MRVLLVDGSVRVRACLAERLRAVGMDVVEAPDMARAVAAVEVADLDAIFVDVHIEAGGGVEGLVELRRLAPRSLLVALTNEANEVHRRECMRHGADAFLDKSREFDAAVELVVARSNVA